MRSNLVRWLLTATLAGGSLLGTQIDEASAQPGERRKLPPRKGGIDTGATVVVDMASPREAPPPPRAEKIGRRRGWTWVTGQWEWSNRGRWEWQAGRWEKERPGKRWRDRRWEQQGTVWVKIDGDWIDDRPAAAPPPMKEEKWQARRGHVWVRGNWDWRNGNWDWVPGHWERERAGKRWRDPKWELQGSVWVRANGDWMDAPRFPTAAPPAPQVEPAVTKAGHIWVRGRWDWHNGDWQWMPGHWERQRASYTWQEGRWENRGGQWTWIDGAWVAAAQPAPQPMPQPAPMPPIVAYPTIAPPPPQAENPGSRSGFIWIRGRWDWRGGKWDWVAGHWERARANYRWNEGRWDNRNGQYIWVDGTWQAGAMTPPPTVGPVAPPQPPMPPPVATPPAPLPGPTIAPPAPQAENPGPRAGFIWIRGRWDWRTNKYEWIPGHWERQRASVRWSDGRWEPRQQSGATYYIWLEGSWR